MQKLRKIYRQLAPTKRKALKLVKLPSFESDLLKTDEDIAHQSRARNFTDVCLVRAGHKLVAPSPHHVQRSVDFRNFAHRRPRRSMCH